MSTKNPSILRGFYRDKSGQKLLSCVIQDKSAAFARQGDNRFEPELELYREAIHVGELAESGKAEENREKLKKIGSNFRIGRRRLSVEFKKTWGFIFNFNSARAEINNFSADFFKSPLASSYCNICWQLSACLRD